MASTQFPTQTLSAQASCFRATVIRFRKGSNVFRIRGSSSLPHEETEICPTSSVGSRGFASEMWDAGDCAEL
jgi:hypothetical protein